MEMLWNSLFVLFVLFVVNRIRALLRKDPSDIPLVASAWSDGITGKPLRVLLQIGYDTYSKASKVFRASDIYVLPPALFSEFRKLPSTVMNSSAANEKVLKLQRNLGEKFWDVIQFVRQDVVRSIPSQIPMMRDEIYKHFSENYTTEDGSWRDVKPWDTTFEMMCCFASRLLVGSELRNNPVFVKKLGDFTKSVSIECLLLGQLPDVATTFLGPVLPAKRHVRDLTEMLRGPIMSCIQESEDGTFEMREKIEYPNESLLPQFVAHVLPKLPTPITSEALIKDISGRLLGLLFAVIDTTTMTFTQVLFDLLSQPESVYTSTLRAEITSVLAANGGKWTSEALAQLKHLDSFIHESQRLHPIGPALAARMCIAPGGHTLSNGDFLPYGAIIQMPVWSVHIDPTNYPPSSTAASSDPLVFDGFRFATDQHPESVPSDIFLGFGHGNHACPGRRVAQAMLKLMVVEILQEYEFQLLEKRPEDWLFGKGIVPDMKQVIRLRSRAKDN